MVASEGWGGRIEEGRREKSECTHIKLLGYPFLLYFIIIFFDMINVLL